MFSPSMGASQKHWDSTGNPRKDKEELLKAATSAGGSPLCLISFKIPGIFASMGSCGNAWNASNCDPKKILAGRFLRLRNTACFFVVGRSVAFTFMFTFTTTFTLLSLQYTMRRTDDLTCQQLNP